MQLVDVHRPCLFQLRPNPSNSRNNALTHGAEQKQKHSVIGQAILLPSCWMLMCLEYLEQYITHLPIQCLGGPQNFGYWLNPNSSPLLSAFACWSFSLLRLLYNACIRHTMGQVRQRKIRSRIIANTKLNLSSLASTLRTTHGWESTSHIGITVSI